MKAHFVSNARVCGDWPRPHTRRRGRYSSLPRSKSTGLIIWTCTAASDSSGHARTRKSMNKIVRKTTDVTLRRRHSIDQHRSLSWKGSFVASRWSTLPNHETLSMRREPWREMRNGIVDCLNGRASVNTYSTSI